MMNKLIIAAAGSGKTTHIVKESLKIKDERILITTFTESNELEIQKKFYEFNGCIPQNVAIQTWFSFLLEHGIKPFQGKLTDKKINGILLVNQKSGLRFTNKNGRPIYWGEDNFDKYYFTDDYRVYTDKIAKLAVRCNEQSSGAVISRISNLFQYIFIDEVQDMAGYDLELIKLLLQSNASVLLVGDPRQVTYHTHDEQKYSKYKDGNIHEFIQEECKEIACDIDSISLNVTHRNNPVICDLSNKLYPNYPPCTSAQDDTTEHSGVFMIKSSDIEEYLQVYKPIQLRDSKRTSANRNFDVYTFGSSKGLTFERVLIYPTKPMIDWLKNHNNTLKNESRSKFYVALTRAKYSVAIVVDYDKNKDIDDIQKFEFI